MRLDKIKKVQKDLYALFVPRAMWLHRKKQSLESFALASGLSPEVFGFTSIKKVRSLATPLGTRKLYVRVNV